MKATILTRASLDGGRGIKRSTIALLSCPLLVMLTGCVEVSAPERPIEINLNINIRQEVVVRLQQDVQDLIKRNPDVF
jgi:YnbE-like lipoprotein